MDKLQLLEKEAIEAAMNSEWDKAIELNEKIIKNDKKNIDAYLRLGFSYLQKSKLKKAKEIYRKAQKYQPGNVLISNNLEKIKVLESKKISKIPEINLNPYVFIDVPGKTKTISLVNIGQKAVLARLTIGQEVYLAPKKRRIEIRSKDKEYIGCLPDDISKRLTIFMKAGSVFRAFIKESTLKTTSVFLKEEKKGKKVVKYASFPINFQSGLNNINLSDEDNKEDDVEEISDNDLEKLAETLSEEKEYLGFEPEEKEEESEE